MTTRFSRFGAPTAFAVILTVGVVACDEAPLGGSAYQREFGISECNMVATGRSPFFVLEPRYRLVLEGGATKVQITVLDETKMVDGVRTRVVEEREWKGGELYEIARNFFAMCDRTKDVFYFGEDVDFYENGKVVDHHGAWFAGRDGAKAGLIIPGAPRRGQKFYQEVAPGVAMDRGEVVEIDETCATPAGTFSNCLKIRERTSYDFWTSLMFWQVEFKFHAPGIGLVQDEDLRLNKYGFVGSRPGGGGTP
jgi:hypothetical protein